MCNSGVKVVRPTLPNLPWRIRQVTEAPQQTSPSDCGIFCVNFFEYDVTDPDLATLTHDRIQLFKEKLAIKMWSNVCIF